MTIKSILFLSFILFSTTLLAQVECQSSVEVYQRNSKLEVEIKTSGDYNFELLMYNGAQKELLKSETGFGNQKLIFSDLADNQYYQVVVLFKAEDAFLCREKVVEAINLIPNN